MPVTRHPRQFLDGSVEPMSTLARSLISEAASLPAAETRQESGVTKAPLLLGLIFTFYGLSVIFVAARMCVRATITRHVGTDDWLIVASVIISTGMLAAQYYEVTLSSGLHPTLLSSETRNSVAKYCFIAVSHWDIGVTTTKVSVLFQYLRFLTCPTARRIIWTLMIIVVICGIITLVVTFAACQPMNSMWHAELQPKAKCIDQKLFWVIQSGYEIASCFAMLAIVVQPLWRLHLSVKRRLGIIILLGLSSSSCVASALRLACVQRQCTLVSVPATPGAHEFNWGNNVPTLYAAIELHAGIICCSLPALMPLRFPIRAWLRPARGTSSALPQIVLPRGPNMEQGRHVAQPMLPTPSQGETTEALQAPNGSRTASAPVEIMNSQATHSARTTLSQQSQSTPLTEAGMSTT
ncbi:hypothetical protein CKM354_001148300 [Cercospora kikuchii]|uniref:Rhodopsin domain-containing protein n=1 Tax=Cercospora kikuchii TaxID=84275 RepID=A0A9P3FKB9_9PEZI|nr:uncharacterized protein CKM354_001148300 [Cercospora kikuchii]GIZ48422.1 hypothetical protein CKM354_001148300 [Cercospora kikuchii]